MSDPLTITMPTEEIFDVTSMGSGLTVLSRRTVELTPDYAQAFLELPEFSINEVKVDRNLNGDHVVRLVREMLRGTFRFEQVEFMTCKLDGREYRMNGQHTAWARIYAHREGFDIKNRTPIQILRYEAKTEADMRQLYASIDRGRPRNMGNVVTSYLLGSEHFPDCKKSVLAVLAQGLAVWLWRDDTGERNLHGGEERSFLLSTDYHKTATQIALFIDDSKPSDFRKLKRAPVVGAMFATFSKAPSIARAFWESVRDGVGISSKDDARLVLRNYLMSCSLGASVPGADVRHISQEEMYRACIAAWNAHRADKPVKLLRVPFDRMDAK